MLLGLGETIPAVDGLVAARLKGYLGLLAALCTGRGIHLARAAAITTVTSGTLGSSGRTTGRATLGLIGKAFGGKELLLFGRKGECLAAIGTLQGFFGVSH